MFPAQKKTTRLCYKDQLMRVQEMIAIRSTNHTEPYSQWAYCSHRITKQVTLNLPHCFWSSGSQPPLSTP
jgi:hypothetical protein